MKDLSIGLQPEPRRTNTNQVQFTAVIIPTPFSTQVAIDIICNILPKVTPRWEFQVLVRDQHTIIIICICIHLHPQDMVQPQKRYKLFGYSLIHFRQCLHFYLLTKTLHIFLQDDEDLAMSPNAVSTYLIDQHHVYETRIDPMRAGVASYATMPRRPIKVKTASSAGSAISSFRQHPHHRSHYGEQLKREAYIQSLGNINISSRFFIT